MKTAWKLFAAMTLATVAVMNLPGAEALTDERVQETVICKSPGRVAEGSGAGGKAVRMLRIYETGKSDATNSAEGCRATYSKTNNEQVVGVSRQIRTCQSILSGIQKNLEASKWNCRRVGSMGILKSKAAVSSEAMGASSTPVSNSTIQ